ncbi:hypothetical protein PR202_ga10727 [Eleusine coracana subsp. coracana]|uniref:Uncharacterized protein n=1 Tax=Eleusine coracana subsp. coracana TaxID=191504 RepID=A0AAV5C7K1_ELECO|nr:hypothetical protein PR202_ga10727 [Eleusine coracana subsp. coracana]
MYKRGWASTDCVRCFFIQRRTFHSIVVSVPLLLQFSGERQRRLSRLPLISEALIHSSSSSSSDALRHPFAGDENPPAHDAAEELGLAGRRICRPRPLPDLAAASPAARGLLLPPGELPRPPAGFPYRPSAPDTPVPPLRRTPPTPPPRPPAHPAAPHVRRSGAPAPCAARGLVLALLRQRRWTETQSRTSVGRHRTHCGVSCIQHEVEDGYPGEDQGDRGRDGPDTEKQSDRISSWTTEGKVGKVEDTVIGASKGINGL